MELVKKTHNWANLPPLSELDLADRAMDWQDELEPEIPRERLPDAVRRARKNHTSTFPINLYEISAAYREILEEENTERERIIAEEKAKIPTCYPPHINEAGDVQILSLFTDTDEIVPCKTCRFEDYEKWRKSQVALYGEIQPLTKLQAEAPVKRTVYKEPVLSTEELQQIQDEYHNLVFELVEDDKSRRNLAIVWDEGAEVFKYPERADVCFSPKDIQRKIEDYKKILAEKR